MLTPKQKEHFDVFGFLCLRQAFSPDEMAEITQAADQVWREDRGGQPDDGQHQGLAPFAELNPRLLDLAEDDRIFQVAADLLGPDFLWSGSEGNKEGTYRKGGAQLACGPARSRRDRVSAAQGDALPDAHHQRTGSAARDPRFASHALPRVVVALTEPPLQGRHDRRQLRGAGRGHPCLRGGDNARRRGLFPPQPLSRGLRQIPRAALRCLQVRHPARHRGQAAVHAATSTHPIAEAFGRRQ